MKRLALWKRQDVPFVKNILELIRKYTKEAIRKEAVYRVFDKALWRTIGPMRTLMTHLRRPLSLFWCNMI